MYNQGLLPGTTTFGKIAGTCILCTAIGVTPVESVSFKDYTKRSSFEQVLTTTSWENIGMGDDTREKVIILETKVSSIEKGFSDINGNLSMMTEILSDIKADIAVLKENTNDNKWWIRIGVPAIFVAVAGAFWQIFNMLTEIVQKLPK